MASYLVVSYYNNNDRRNQLMDNTSKIEDYLTCVRKPSRYIGGEVNSIKKDPSGVRLTFGLASQGRISPVRGSLRPGLTWRRF
jgi:hypothetical protein